MVLGAVGRFILLHSSKSGIQASGPKASRRFFFFAKTECTLQILHLGPGTHFFPLMESGQLAQDGCASSFLQDLLASPPSLLPLPQNKGKLRLEQALGGNPKHYNILLIT